MVSIAYLGASIALLVLGAYVLIDSLLKLVAAEHPPIGMVEVLGQQVWLGWLMLPALAWSAIPAVILGRMKMPLASDLHDKILYADAKMNKADWMTASAAMVGVIGIGLGLWWADAVAATVIALDITHDGWRNLSAATRDLMDERPMRYDGSGPDPLQDKVDKHVARVGWVKDHRVRLREEGHVYTGEVAVVPRSDSGLIGRLESLRDDLLALHWKLHDVVVVPVSRLDAADADEQDRVERG